MIITFSNDFIVNLMVKFFKDFSIPSFIQYSYSREAYFYTGQSALRCIIVLLGKHDNIPNMVENINRVVSKSPSDTYQKIVFVNIDYITQSFMELEGRFKNIDSDLPQEMFRDGDQFSPHDSDTTWGFDKLFHFVAQNAVTKIVVPDYQYVDDEYWIVDHKELTDNEKKYFLDATYILSNRFLAFDVEKTKELFSPFFINIDVLTEDYIKRKRSFIINPKNILGGQGKQVVSIRHIFNFLHNIEKSHNDIYKIDGKVKNLRKIVFHTLNNSGLGHVSRISRIVHCLLKQEKNIRIYIITEVECDFFFEGLDVKFIVLVPVIKWDNYTYITESHRIFMQELRDASVFIFDGPDPRRELTYAMNAVFNGQSIWLRRGGMNRHVCTKNYVRKEYFFDHVICPGEVFPEICNRDIIHHIVPTFFAPVCNNPDEILSDDTKIPAYDIVIGLGGLDMSMYKNLIDAILYFSLMHPHLKIFFLAWPSSYLSREISARKDKSKNVEVGFVPHAVSIMRTSRFFIGMSGYSSFTEVIMNRIPSILYPAGQKNTDLQIFRAHTAAQHGVALLGEWNMFGLIQQMEAMLNDRFYNSIRDKLKALSLPKPGQEEISKKIIACMEKT